jgi:hypothetical protein
MIHNIGVPFYLQISFEKYFASLTAFELNSRDVQKLRYQTEASGPVFQFQTKL